jgi:hypothetical protein
MIKDCPLYHRLEASTDNVIKQKLVTLLVRNGMLVEETIERDYASSGDYTDSIITVPLISVKEDS